MPDEARELAEQLLQAAKAQGEAVKASNWSRFVTLAKARAAVVVRLDPLVSGRTDLAEIFAAIVRLDQAHHEALRRAGGDMQAEIAALWPRQQGMTAYLRGALGQPEARFIDRRK